MPECEGEGLLTIFNSVPAMRLLENVVMMGGKSPLFIVLHFETINWDKCIIPCITVGTHTIKFK